MTCIRVLSAAALCAALAVSACQKKAEDAAPADAATAPEAAAPAAADAAMPASGDATVPAECNAYLDAVAACTAKLSSSNAAAAQAMQQAADQTRASWASIPEQGALSMACKQATDAFKASSAASGC